MLHKIVIALRALAVICFCILGFATIVATGGGGGGGAVAPGTTPLNEADDSTATGTYRAISMEFYYSTGEYFSSAELDYFDARMTIDVAADWTTYKMEWHDDVYGDYYDYDEHPLSYVDPNVSYDNAYYHITGPYTIDFFYDNLCSEGICADVVLRLQKISDSVEPLLGRSTARAIGNAFDEGGENPFDGARIVSESMGNIGFLLLFGG